MTQPQVVSQSELLSRANKKAKTTKTNEKKNHATRNHHEISYVEFYSGIGGWTMALEEAVTKLPSKHTLKRIAALDHSDLCTNVFQHNFGTDKKAFNIERLTVKQVNEWNATIWAMSPPCQPHTRQHNNQSEDLKDPRSASFLHLCDLLELMTTPPKLLCLENVIGFESSRSFQRWEEVLQGRGYRVGHFHLTPTQVGLPNDRPRYFCIAVRSEDDSGKSSEMGPTEASLLAPYFEHHIRTAENEGTTSSTRVPNIRVAVPEVGIQQPNNDTGDPPCLPPLSSFLDDTADDTLTIPQKVIEKNAAWCFDIVTPSNSRSSCFTSSYGRYMKGTGSVLYPESSGISIPLIPPEQREFQTDWAKDLDTSKLRYFSGTEMARLFGFQTGFSFPSSISTRQQWKLVGNSLNVRVAARLVELGLKVMIR